MEKLKKEWQEKNKPKYAKGSTVKGGGVGNIKERVIDYYINNSDNEDLINLMGVSDVPNLKQVAEKWVNNRDSYYDKIFSAIDGIHNRTWAENKFEELGLEKYKDGGRVDKDYMYSKFDFNKSGNFFATINNKNYEIIYRDDISQMYDLFENDKKIKSSKNLADLFYFPKKYAEGGATKGFCYTIGGL